MPISGEGIWTKLLVDGGATPPSIIEERFRAWMGGRRIFVSSVMDDEMLSSRLAVREYLSKYGAEAIMWESITPADARPQDAYLEGVRRSEIFLLIVGSRYGQSDASGYSPIHKEGNRAAELGLTRLLFEKSGINAAERDGRLNDWTGSLYSELSGGKYGSPEELVSVVDSRLREIASMQETYWVKIGNLVFPGSVRRSSSGNQTTFVVTSEIRDAAVRRAIGNLLKPGMGQSSETRLSWASETHRVRITEVTSHSLGMSAEEFKISCSATETAMWRSYSPMTYVDNYGKSFGPREQAEVWLSTAVFGNQITKPSDHPFYRNSSGEPGPSLANVLSSTGARGWRAEGLTRLYLVEELDRLFAGYVSELEVGPATAASIRVVARLTLSESGDVDTQGMVPLPR
jgi:hypothetical protein